MSLDLLKLIFGYLLLGILGTLIWAVARGQVFKDSSYGLDSLILGLMLLIQKWAEWAFIRRSGKPDASVEDKEDDK